MHRKCQTLHTSWKTSASRDTDILYMYYPTLLPEKRFLKFKEFLQHHAVHHRLP